VFSLVGGKLRDDMMQAVQRVIVDGVDGTGRNQLAVVIVDLDINVVLKVGQKFVTDSEGVTGNITDSRPLCWPIATLHVRPRVVDVSSAQRCNTKVVHACLAKQSVALQVCCQNPAAADNADSNHVSCSIWRSC